VHDEVALNAVGQPSDTRILQS